MKLQTFIVFFVSTLTACSQNRGVGYQFELFQNTTCWKLAKAVDKEDLKEIKRILENKNININLQEPKYHTTILHLAISNDRLNSTRILLERNANFNLLDIDKRSAMDMAVNDIKSKKNSYKIIELLIKHGADINIVRSHSNNNDTLGYSIPLMDAVNDLDCAKLLLDHGANPYFKTGDTYPVWFFMLLRGDINDNIYVAKYMIVDTKMLIPNPISYTVDKKPLNILDLLSDLDLSKDTKKQMAKEEIIIYLKNIGFPDNGVYSMLFRDYFFLMA